MTQTTPGTQSHLPIRGFLIVFTFLLIVVSFTASIFGENNKINITAQRLMENVAAGEPEKAYDLLTDSAKKRIDFTKFKARMAPLRMYLRAQYGANFSNEYKYASRHKFWLPWFDESLLKVTVGLYRKEQGVISEIKVMLSTPDFDRPPLPDLLVVARQGGRWLVDDINFDPEKYAGIINKIKSKDIFSPTANGFVLEGFVYDRRTATPDERAFMMDTLTQALQELQADSGVKKQETDDMMKMIP